MQYLGANVPQAWAAGSPSYCYRRCSGIQQDAPRGKLYVDPALPAWLPDVTLIDLRLGGDGSISGSGGTARRLHSKCLGESAAW